MKKKLLFSLIYGMSLIADADVSEPYPSSWNGIHYSSFKDMNLPDEIKNNMESDKKSISIKGYVEKENPYVKVLLNAKKTSIQELKSYKNNPNPLDTHLKTNLSEIKLSIPFKEISSIKKENVIGYAPSNSYTSSSDKNAGWTGVSEFFTDDYLGTCHYIFNKIKSVQLSKEYTEYFINGKPSSKIIEGNYHSGFLYTINWYKENTQNDLYLNILECANMKFDKNILAQMIDLAKKIDRQ